MAAHLGTVLSESGPAGVSRRSTGWEVLMLADHLVSRCFPTSSAKRLGWMKWVERITHVYLLSFEKNCCFGEVRCRVKMSL